jgi:hypothetical protein
MTALLLAWPGLALGYFLQAKGFSYHLVPLEVATELSAAVAVISILHASRWGAVGMSTALLAAVGALTLPAMKNAFPRPDFVAGNPVLTAIRTYDTGNGMLLLDTGAMPAIFAAPLYGTRIASRSQCPWLLRPMVKASLQETGEKAAQTRVDIEVLVQGVVDDFRRYQPDVVVVNEAPVLADGSSYLSYLSRNPEFAALWPGYRLVASEIWGNKPIGIYIKAP